jgi:hypothetical protein
MRQMAYEDEYKQQELRDREAKKQQPQQEQQRAKERER